MPEIAYVNGEFMPLDRAVVHVEDRGFQFADSVYEVMRTYGGKLFAVDEHLERLFRSLTAIELAHHFTIDQLKSIAVEAVQRSEFDESIVYLQITRGRAPRRRHFPEKTEPTIVLTVRHLEPLSREVQETGIKVVTVPDVRWARCDIKSVALLANVLSHHDARKAGAHDAIFVDTDGAVAEATAGNVFVVQNGALRTPPKGPRILSGVTRGKILQAAAALKIPTREDRILKTDLYTADEIFLTSTTSEMLPVVEVDGRAIGKGKPGPVGKKIYEQFLEMFARG